MSLQISLAFSGRTLSVRLDLSYMASLVLFVDHPFVGFLYHLSQGSPKAFEHIELLRIVDEGARPAAEPTADPAAEPAADPALLAEVKEGLEKYAPEMCEEGVNGTYFMRNKDGKMGAIFKPADEEGGSQNNPKRDEEGARQFADRGVPEGEGALREVAAYLLDREGFSGVPETMMATLGHPSWGAEKTGSLQRFVDNDGAVGEIGPGKFPVKEVHKIGILDMRILNTDRHEGNILFREGDEGIELVPIDHGLCLPSSLHGAWFEWMTWPQAKVPFDEDSLQYIRSVDVDEDARVLENLGIGKDAIKTMRISTALLKKGANAGLCLRDIASIACREDLEEPCALEKMWEKALMGANGDEEAALAAMDGLLDQEIAKMCE